jgi:hypothetical protein
LDNQLDLLVIHRNGIADQKIPISLLSLLDGNAKQIGLAATRITATGWSLFPAVKSRATGALDGGCGNPRTSRQQLAGSSVDLDVSSRIGQ